MSQQFLIRQGDVLVASAAMYETRYGVTSFNELSVSQATAVIADLQSAIDSMEISE